MAASSRTCIRRFSAQSVKRNAELLQVITPKFQKPSDLVAWSFDQDLGDVTDVLRRYYVTFIRSFSPGRRKKYDLQLDGLNAAVREGAVKTILDVGCGCGSVSLWLALQGAEVTGIDITEERLKVARRRAALLGLADRTSFASINVLEMEGTFDAIWIEQAYHHLEPRGEVQAKIASLLNPGGLLIISETNAWNPLVQAQLLKARGFTTIREHVDDQGRVHTYGDERITTPASLTREFARYGVNVEGRPFFYGVLPNHPAVERFEAIESIMPAFMIPAFTHYLWQGRKVGRRD